MSDLPTCDCYETYPGPGTHREGCRVRDEIERLTAAGEDLLKRGAEKDNKIHALTTEVSQLKIDLDLALRPIYCPICGSCGEDGCCDPTICKGGNHCLYPVADVQEETNANA